MMGHKIFFYGEIRLISPKLSLLPLPTWSTALSLKSSVLKILMKKKKNGGAFAFPFLARLDQVQEELLYYPQCQRWRRRQQNVKVFTLKFFFM